MYAKDVVGGNRNFGQQRLVDHPVVAFGASGCDVTLVAKEEVSVLPVKVLVISGQQRIESFGSRASRERNREASVEPDGDSVPRERTLRQRRDRDPQQWL